MKFEITLRGFNGETDATDHLIIWVASDLSLDELKLTFSAKGLTDPGGLVIDVCSLDLPTAETAFALPDEMNAFIEEATKLVALTESGETVYVCGCGKFVGSIDDLREIDDVHERVQPGEFMAAGCCPACGNMLGVKDQDVPDYTLEIAGKIMRSLGWTVLAPDAARKDPARLFVERVAELKKWGEPDSEGKAFEPSDGLEDSHTCLMDLIDDARDVVAGVAA